MFFPIASEAGKSGTTSWRLLDVLMITPRSFLRSEMYITHILSGISEKWLVSLEYASSLWEWITNLERTFS